MPVALRTSVYCTYDDIIALGAPDASLSALPSDTIDKACAFASDVADSLLGNQYAVPLEVWAHDVVWATSCLAAHRLMAIIGYNPEGSNSMFQTMRDEAMEWLKDVAASRAAIAGGDKRGPSVVGGPVILSKPQRGW